jgi:hypothetical protein
MSDVAPAALSDPDLAIQELDVVNTAQPGDGVMRPDRSASIACWSVSSSDMRPPCDSESDFCPSFSPPPYPITPGQVNAAVPFGNLTVAASIDGATLKAILENGASQMPTPDFRFPQVSGLCFTYDIEAVAGARVTGAARQAQDGSCTGAPIEMTAASSYTLATNNYVVAGGDSCPVVTDFAMSGYIEHDVSEALTTAGMVTPRLQDRIVCTDPHPGSGSNCPTRMP